MLEDQLEEMKHLEEKVVSAQRDMGGDELGQSKRCCVCML